MKRLIICALLVTNPVLAETYLCVGESSVEFTIDQTEVTAESYNLKNTNFIVSQGDDGKYRAGFHGSDHKRWNSCYETRSDKVLFHCRYKAPNGDFAPDYTFQVTTGLTFYGQDIAPPDGEGMTFRMFGGKCSKL